MPENDPNADPNARQPGGYTPAAGPPPAYTPAPAGYPAQPVYYQPQPAPVYPAATPAAQRTPVAAAPAPAAPQPKATNEDTIERDRENPQPELVIVSHSTLFYWWPVWAVGYLMAIFSWLHGQTLQVGDAVIHVHPSNNAGVLFFLTLYLVILISNVEVRGLASLAVVLTLILAAVLLAYFRVWDRVLGWIGELNIYLNQGAYFWFSTLLFLTWASATYVFDRFTYWVIKPGQITREHFWGAGSESYDTENMVLEKRRNDLFRHWILGLGSGDLRIHTYGGRPEEIFIPNVLFVGFKIEAIQRLIAEKPAEFGHPTIK